MTKERIEKAVEIIEYAIKNNISVRQASINNGYSGTYVKNIKSQVNEKYDAGVLDDDLYDLFQSAYDQYTGTDNSDDERGKTNINLTVDKELSRFGDADKEIKGENYFTTEKDNVMDIGFSGNVIKTVPELLEAAQIDTSLWEVKSKIANAWTTPTFTERKIRDEYGEIIGTEKVPTFAQNYQVKVRLEQIKEEKDARNVAKIFQELVQEYQPPKVDTKQFIKSGNTPSENNLLEVSLFDLHIGKLGWAGEVGENYDTKIAVARFQDAITNLIQRAKGFEISRILFPIGNDFFNSDNLHNTTTNGTPQDEDLRWQKTFKMGCQLIVDGINKLKLLGVPIDVMVIPGNHDFERSYYMGTVVEAWFRDDDMVNVDNGANPRKYYRFGEVLLGFTHGNNEKEASLPMLMANEEKKSWGKTTFKEWHLGHFHRKRSTKYTVFDKAIVLNEDLGVTVRYLSSLSGTEEWHFKKGYVGTQKAGEAFIWNDKIGMIGHLNFNFTNFNREH